VLRHPGEDRLGSDDSRTHWAKRRPAVIYAWSRSLIQELIAFSL
jgi:hypothetical protein